MKSGLAVILPAFVAPIESLVKRMEEMENKDRNMALLKDLMTVPPMTAEQHAAIVRKRIEQRRMVEEARERTDIDNKRFEEH